MARWLGRGVMLLLPGGPIRGRIPKLQSIASHFTIKEYYPDQGWINLTQEFVMAFTLGNGEIVDIYRFISPILANNIEAFMVITKEEGQYVVEISRLTTLSLEIFYDEGSDILWEGVSTADKVNALGYWLRLLPLE